MIDIFSLFILELFRYFSLSWLLLKFLISLHSLQVHFLHIVECFLPTFEIPFSFSTLQQLGADPQHWIEVYAILKGTSLCCYHRQEDVEASIEPAFTIAINKVGTSSINGEKALSRICSAAGIGSLGG